MISVLLLLLLLSLLLLLLSLLLLLLLSLLLLLLLSLLLLIIVFVIIIYPTEEDGLLGNYCIIQYSFTGEEHPISLRPHKNAKTNQKGYVRTCQSTMEKLKSLGGQQGPSAAFHTLFEGKGNLTEVRGLSELPKSTKQVSYLARRPSSVQQQGSSSHRKDTWYDLLVEYKTHSRFQDTAFLRKVKYAPEPTWVLGNNRQINDIARFCTDPTEFQPIYVDATFNLG